MKLLFAGCVLLAVSAAPVEGAEWHVAINGNDANRGTRSAPLRTIQHAADLARPGDTITVHAGTYREWINPPHGGASDRKRIVYRGAPGEKVEIKGSELVTNWVRVQDRVWKASLPNTFFGEFNPFADRIHGDWFDGRGRPHHTGAVYVNGDWLIEAAKLEEVLAPLTSRPAWLGKLTAPLWFARVDGSNTTIWAQFPRGNPNKEQVEINVRRTVFYPAKPGCNYLTVRGFIISQAATPWAPPTAEQIGLIGTHWSKGWIIENNVIRHSICSGIALGKYGDAFDNTSANTAEGYVKTIERALKNGWNRDSIGHHVVRNNTITDCEQAGIVGSLGAAFSTITGNTIHDIHVRRLFTGAEMAGIKFHGAIDTVISQNHIYRTCLGLWLDWMAQGTRVSGNLFHDNAGEDLFVEVDHGPFLADNNLFLSGTSLLDMSEGGAYVHNLFAGRIINSPEPNRETPYHPAHATAVAGLARIKGGDDRFYNNLFVGDGVIRPEVPASDEAHWVGGYGLSVYNGRAFPLFTGGNVFYHGAQAYGWETNALVSPGRDPHLRLVKEEQGFVLEFTPGLECKEADTQWVNSALLGKARVAGLPYERADGSPISLSRDYFNKRRDRNHPCPGPFAKLGHEPVRLRVWPLKK